MNAREYFGDRFFERAVEPETFPTFSQWVYMHTVAERQRIESVVRESIRARESSAVDAPPVPPMPAAVADPCGLVRESWGLYHSAPRSPHGSGHTPVGPPRFTRRVGDDDPSGWPEDLR